MKPNYKAPLHAMVVLKLTQSLGRTANARTLTIKSDDFGRLQFFVHTGHTDSGTPLSSEDLFRDVFRQIPVCIEQFDTVEEMAEYFAEHLRARGWNVGTAIARAVEVIS